MTCAEVENALADYLDGTLGAAGCVALEAHIADCAACREFVADASAGFEVLKTAEPVLPPPDLVTHIAFQSPLGRTPRPFERRSWLNRTFTGWLQPVLQPRFAMGMAMTVLSFAMLERCTGIRVQHIDAADLNPMTIVHGIDDRVVRVKDRTVKYYENLRLVYDIDTRLQEMEEENEQTRAKNAAARTDQTPASAGKDATKNQSKNNGTPAKP